MGSPLAAAAPANRRQYNGNNDELVAVGPTAGASEAAPANSETGNRMPRLPASNNPTRDKGRLLQALVERSRAKRGSLDDRRRDGLVSSLRNLIELRNPLQG